MPFFATARPAVRPPRPHRRPRTPLRPASAPPAGRRPLASVRPTEVGFRRTFDAEVTSTGERKPSYVTYSGRTHLRKLASQDKARRTHRRHIDRSVPAIRVGTRESHLPWLGFTVCCRAAVNLDRRVGPRLRIPACARRPNGRPLDRRVQPLDAWSRAGHDASNRLAEAAIGVEPDDLKITGCLLKAVLAWILLPTRATALATSLPLTDWVYDPPIADGRVLERGSRRWARSGLPDVPGRFEGRLCLRLMGTSPRSL
jgi:hypothetical protein